MKLNKKEVDGKEEHVLIPSMIGMVTYPWAIKKETNELSEEGLVDRYADLIITAHAEHCLWRQRGCDGKPILYTTEYSITSLRHYLQTITQ